MSNTLKPQVLFQQKEQKNALLWQDKGTSLAGRVTLLQPAPPRHKASAQQNTDRSKKLDKITTRVTPEVKAELQRIAGQNGLSISATSAAFLERAVQRNVGMQYHTLLKSVIEETIRAEFRAFFNRYLAINARIAYEVGQILSLIMSLLGIVLKKDGNTLHQIEMDSEKSARANVTRRTQPIDEIVGKMKQFMTNGNGEVN